jgi:GMP synthase-like glutamine amidotransferase
MPAAPPPLKVCFIDMNAGVENQAIRCLQSVIARFEAELRESNPTLPIDVVTVSPRDTLTPIPRGHDLYIASGGPGSPLEGLGTPWYDDFRRLTDGLLEAHDRDPRDAASMFAICYSYELMAMHLDIAEVVQRDGRKFGVMPIYTTTAGRHHPLLAPFGDRLFAFEHRNWEVVNMDETRLALMNGAVLARESREGRDDKGLAVLAFNVGEAVETVQFHPEADLAGIFNWIDRPEQATAFKESYGDHTFERMLKTISNPERVARVHHEVIPGWMRRRFNAICAARGWDAMPYGHVEALSGADLSVLQGGMLLPDEPSSPAA